MHMYSNVSTTNNMYFTYIHSKGSWWCLSIPGGAIAYSLELGCDPKRILDLNQNNLFFAVKRRDAEKVQARKQETVSKNMPL